MHRLIPIALLAGVTLGAQAPSQLSAPAGPAFEVASVKPNVSDATLATSDDRPGSYTATNVTPRRLLLFAYRLHPVLDRDRVVGPAWIDTARFDISARMPADTPVAQIPDMVRALLVDRFKLAAHLESREGPVYALVPARADARADARLGPQLTPSTLDCSQRSNFVSMEDVQALAKGEQMTRKKCGMSATSDANGGVLYGGGRSMAELAKNLTGSVSRVVVDRTGLSGSYDFLIRFTPQGMTPRIDGVASPSTDGTSIFTALQEQLGLKLEAQRGPVEYVVVDRIEQPSPD